MNAEQNNRTAIPACLRWIARNDQNDDRTWHPRTVRRKMQIPSFVLPAEREQAYQRQLAANIQ